VILALVHKSNSLICVQEEAFAIVHVRILTVTKGDIDSGTILVRGEKIVEVGKDVKVPDGTRIIEGKGLIAFPGMVNAASRIGASDSFGSGGGAATPQNAAFDEINPASDIFTLALRTGITTYGVHPAGGTIAGQGALLKPVGLQKETMVLDKSAFLRISFQAGTQSKETLRQALDAAKKQIEAEKKNPKPSSAPQTSGNAGAPEGRPAKPEEKAPPVVRFLRGEIPALVGVAGPAEILHFWQVMDGFAEFRARVAFMTSPESYKAAEELGKRKALVLLRPDLTFAPFTRDRINPASEMLRAGAVVGFSPGADAGEAAESYLFRVSEMVKYGLSRDAALRAMTIVPAEMLGLEKRVGSIEAGKDADLLLFDADPLSAGARLKRAFINGKEVYGGE
jgi:imidazolonepropionase-like amidohydrolase